MQTVRVDQLANVLAEAVRDGVRLEQARIIKLLEDKAFWLVHLDRLDEVELLRNLIALIKGDGNATA